MLIYPTTQTSTLTITSPATIGIPSTKPSCYAALFDKFPTISVPTTNLGNFSSGIFNFSEITLLQILSLTSKGKKYEAVDSSIRSSSQPSQMEKKRLLISYVFALIKNFFLMFF